MENATAVEGRVAIVTGANRGIGYETCRQLAKKGVRVLLTSRDAAKGRAASVQLGVDFHPLDVTDPTSVSQLVEFVDRQCGRLDILVNNAGVFLDRAQPSILHASIDTLRHTLETNLYGALRLCQAFVPLMRRHNCGRILNVSSGMGQLSDMQGQYPAYRLSKTALNAVTRILAAELADTHITVNSVCPGWVRTDMGGESAPRSVQEGADTIVWLATLPENCPTGGFFRDRKPIPW